MPDYKGEEEHGQELGKPDQAEKEGAARERVNLPSDGNRQHLIGERDETREKRNCNKRRL